MFISLSLWIYRWLARFWEGPLRRAWAMYILQVLRLLNHAEPTGKSVEMSRVLNLSPRSLAGHFFKPPIAWNVRWTRAVLQAAASSVGLHKKASSFCYRTLDSGSPCWRRGLQKIVREQTKTEDLALYSEIFFLIERSRFVFQAVLLKESCQKRPRNHRWSSDKWQDVRQDSKDQNQLENIPDLQHPYRKRTRFAASALFCPRMWPTLDVYWISAIQQ